jgi:hypothetical protein
MAQSARQPGFACARLPRDEQILMAFDPFAARQFLKQGAVETAGGTVIDILGCGLLAEASKTQPGCQTFAVNGPLFKPGETKSECEALAGLFAGVLASFRNPGAHTRRTFADVLEAMEEMMVASRLLRLVDQRRLPQATR